MARIKYYDVSTGTVKYADTITSSIDDATISSAKTWSSAKILQELSQSESNIYSNTTEGWNAQPSLISDEHTIYVYSDAGNVAGIPVPWLKIGDGAAYLIDLPFVNQEEIEHMSNQTIHVSNEDRLNWDSKVRVYNVGETAVFTTE